MVFSICNGVNSKSKNKKPYFLKMHLDKKKEYIQQKTKNHTII